MDQIPPETKFRPTTESQDLSEDPPIPWDELSEGSRQFLEDLRVSLRQVRKGETIDAKESLEAIRRELEQEQDAK